MNLQHQRYNQELTRRLGLRRWDAWLGNLPWLMGASFAFLCWQMHSDDFMPLLFFAVTSSPNSIALSAAFPLGSLTAMTVNTVAASRGWVQNRQSRDKLFVYMIFVAFFSFACLSQLAHPVDVVAEPSGAGMIFLVSLLVYIAGFSLAPGYYLLVNIYSIEAGKDGCATLVGIYEFVAFCSKGLADPVLLNMADTSSWKATIGTLSLLALTSGVLLYIFLHRCETIRVCGLLADSGGHEQCDHEENGYGAGKQDSMQPFAEAGKEPEAGFVKEYAAMRRRPVNGMSE